LQGNVIQRGISFIKRQKKPFKVNMVRASAQSFLLYLTKQYQSIYIRSLGASPFQLGIVNSIGGIAGTIVTPFIGWLADKHGIRKMLLLGTSLMTLSALFFTAAYDWIMTIPATFIFLLATQWLMTICPMVCGSYLKNEERATAKQLCDTLSAIPTIAAPMVAATIITRFGGLNSEGIRPLYSLQTIGFLLTFFWVYTFYFDSLKKRKEEHSFVGGVKEIFSGGAAVKRWLFYIFLSSSTTYLSWTYLPVFITEVKHGDEFVVGSITTLSMIPPVTLALVLGRLADTFGRKKVIYLTNLIYCISIILLIQAQNITMLLISGVLQGFFMLSAVTQDAVSQELMPVYLLGRWYGIISLFRGIASIAAPVVGGFIWSVIGPNYVFLLIILIETSKTILIWLAIPETLR